MSLKIIVVFAASFITCSLGWRNTRECSNARYPVDLKESYIGCNGGNENACVASPDEEGKYVAARFVGKYPDNYGGITTGRFILTGDNFNITLESVPMEHMHEERDWKFDFYAAAALPENLPVGENGTIRAIVDYGCEDYGFCLERDLEIRNKF